MAFDWKQKRLRNELAYTSKAGHLPLQSEELKMLMRLFNVWPTKISVPIPFHTNPMKVLMQDFHLYLENKNASIFQAIFKLYNQFWTNIIYDFIIKNMPLNSGAFVVMYVLRTIDAQRFMHFADFLVHIQNSLHGVYYEKWRWFY